MHSDHLNFRSHSLTAADVERTRLQVLRTDAEVLRHRMIHECLPDVTMGGSAVVMIETRRLERLLAQIDKVTGELK